MLLNSEWCHMAELKEMRFTNSFFRDSRNQSSLYLTKIIEPRIEHLRCAACKYKSREGQIEEEKFI